MELPAAKIVKQIICLRVMPDNEWNADRDAERVQRKDDKGRLLFSHEVLLLASGQQPSRPLACWLRSAQGELPPKEGDTLVADNLVLSLFTDREGKTRWSMTADTVSASA